MFYAREHLASGIGRDRLVRTERDSVLGECMCEEEAGMLEKKQINSKYGEQRQDGKYSRFDQSFRAVTAPWRG